jgi:hypothetical protein
LSKALLAYPGSTLVNLMCRVEQKVVRAMLATKRSRNSKGKYPDKNGYARKPPGQAEWLRKKRVTVKEETA